MKSPILYLQKVPVTDLVCGKTFDVVAWDDAAKTNKKCHWAWYNDSRPDKRHKTVMFNCYRYNIVWIN